MSAEDGGPFQGRLRPPLQKKSLTLSYDHQSIINNLQPLDIARVQRLPARCYLSSCATVWKAKEGRVPARGTSVVSAIFSQGSRRKWI